MKKILWVLIFCFIGQSAYSYDYFDLGKTAYDNGFYGQAKEYLSIAVKNKPKNTKFRYYYALSLAQLGELDEAAQQYQAITLSAPNSQEGQNSSKALESLKKYFETKSGDYKLPDEDDTNYMPYIIMENKDLKRWEKDLLNVYIQPSNSTSIIETAFKAWEEKSGIVKFNFVPTSSDSDISVSFVEKLPLINYEGGFIDGLATVKYANDTISHADISIKEKNQKTKEVYSPDKIYATALHTIGHAIGLNTHSENPKDIMYWELTDTNKTISKGDINTLKMLYGITEENLADIHNNPSIHAIKLGKAKAYAQAYPNLSISWSSLASAYVAINDYDNAIESIKKAIDISPNDPVLYTMLADYYGKKGESDLAVENYKTAYDIQPDNKVYLFNWAKACYKYKRADEAKADVDSYLLNDGFLANDEISRMMRKMYKQDKEKEKAKIIKDRAEKQRKAKEIEDMEQEMFVD